MPWYHRPDMYDYDYRNGYQTPFYDPRRESDDPLRDAKRGVRFYKSIMNELNREHEKKKKKDNEKDKMKLPSFTTGQMVGIMMISWPFIGMFERWAVNAIFR